MRRPLIALLAVLALVVAGCSDDVGGVASTPEDQRADAPSFSLDGLDGGTVSLADFAGAPVLINFWASWCEPCREEMPALQRFSTATQGVKVLGIAVNDAPSDSRAFARQVGVTFPLAVDRDASLAAKYGVTGLPVTVLVDAQGRVVSTTRGPVSEADLAAVREVAAS
jgi:peroxiredoxin